MRDRERGNGMRESGGKKGRMRGKAKREKKKTPRPWLLFLFIRLRLRLTLKAFLVLGRECDPS